MEKFVIKGGRRLQGEVEISGFKNAAVAILPAAILADSPCVLENVPNLRDVSCILRILLELGAKVQRIDDTTIRIDARNITEPIVPYELARQLRGSYYFLGALIGKCGQARVSMPGGCDLGDRPIDQHIKAFNSLGVTCSIDRGMVDARSDMLIGSPIYFDISTVGATINAMLAAVKARGLTVIENAAKEPHVVDVANFLNSMGADIMGAGTDVIKIRGVDKLTGSTYAIIPDQIEAGTYMAAAVATGGDVLIKNVIPKHLESISAKLEKIGAQIDVFDDAIRVRGTGKLLKGSIKTMPHPGFPTDMQPQVAVLFTLAEGTSIITETIFDNRFKYVDELRRMGADISVDGKVAVIEGTGKLMGAPVQACDLRAGAALIIAGLAAAGVTEMGGVEFIERGYEDMELKLRQLGADIHKCNDNGSAVEIVDNIKRAI